MREMKALSVFVWVLRALVLRKERNSMNWNGMDWERNLFTDTHGRRRRCQLILCA